MKWVSRAAWGAKPSRGSLTYISGTQGTKIHYEGSNIPNLSDHKNCAPHMRGLQASHLANKKENYSDIAYNAVVCPHGYVFEGRGTHRKCGANGNSTLNRNHYAICAMLYLGTPSDEMLNGLRDAIEHFRSAGNAANQILGHRDGLATACPGEKLYAWVEKGAPRPTTRPSGGTTTKPKPSKPTTTKPKPSKPTTTKPKPSKPTTTTPAVGARGSLGSWPGSSVVAVGKNNNSVRKMQLRLRNAIGGTQAKKLNPNGATGYYGVETKAMVRYALRNHPETWDRGETSHDGRVGSLSWRTIDKL